MFLALFWSFICGVIVTVLGATYFIHRVFIKLSEPRKDDGVEWSFDKNVSTVSQYEDFEVPEIDSLIKTNGDSLKALNLLVQFLFQELKDTQAVRRWVKEKLTIEFEELLERPVAKLLIKEIKIVNVNLGNSLPLVSHLEVKVFDAKDGLIQDVQCLADLQYKGCWAIVVKVQGIVGPVLNLHVKLRQLAGPCRLQFTRNPYTHWSFAFTKNPTVDLEIKSYLKDVSVPQITKILRNQLLRLLKKKHTLPNYRMRVKPFFQKPGLQAEVEQQNVTSGVITVAPLTVRRLTIDKTSVQNVYFAVKLSSLKYAPSYNSRSETFVITMTRPHLDTSWGVTFHPKYSHIFDENALVVQEVQVNSSAQKAGLCVGDIVICINRDLKFTLNDKLRLLHAPVLVLHLDILRLYSDREPSPRLEHSETQDANQLNRRSRSAPRMQRTVPIECILKSTPHRTKAVQINSTIKFEESFKLPFIDAHQYLSVFLISSNSLSRDEIVAYANISLVDLLWDYSGPAPSQLQVNLLPLPDAFCQRLPDSVHTGFLRTQCFGDLTISYSVVEEDYSSFAEEHEEEFEVVHDKLAEERKEQPQVHDLLPCQLTKAEKTLCHFCSKKIWLSTALKCSACAIICHKKCKANCMELTVCIPVREAVDVSTAASLATEGKHPADTPDGELGFLAEYYQDDQNSETSSLASFVDSYENHTPSHSNSSNTRAASSSKKPLPKLMENEKLLQNAREQGRDLYTYLPFAERKALLQQQVSKLEQEIDLCAEHKKDMMNLYCSSLYEPQKEALLHRIDKEGERMECMQVLLLQYTCGLKDCLSKED